MTCEQGKKRGFTLIELLVVIAIIGLLATMAVAAVNAARAKARQTKATADLSTIAKAVEIMALDTGQWPGHQKPYEACNAANFPYDCTTNEIEDLGLAIAGLTQPDLDPNPTRRFPNWNGPYMNQIPLDPWGHNYFFDNDYTIDGQVKAVVGSYGSDGVGNNSYDTNNIIYIISR